MSPNAEKVGCGKPMGLSGYLKCYCGQVGVLLCRECKAKASPIGRSEP